jgi:hypothetical protein
MTIWLVSIGVTGMNFLLLTKSSRRIRRQAGSGTHAPRLVPAEETDDGPGQVPDFAEWIRQSQLRAQRRIFAGFPFNRPQPT